MVARKIPATMHQLAPAGPVSMPPSGDGLEPSGSAADPWSSPPPLAPSGSAADPMVVFDPGMISSSAPGPVRPLDPLDDDMMISDEPDPLSAMFGPELYMPAGPRPSPPTRPHAPELEEGTRQPGAPEHRAPPTADPDVLPADPGLSPAAQAAAVSLEERRTAMFLVVLPLLAGGAGATVARTMTNKGAYIAGAAALAAGATIGAAYLVSE